MSRPTELLRPLGPTATSLSRRGAGRPPVVSWALLLLAVLVLAAIAATVLWRPGASLAGGLVLLGAGATLGGLLGHAARSSRVDGTLAGSLVGSLEREARLHAIVSSLHEGLLFHDRDLRIVEANDAARSILRLTDAEVRAHPSHVPQWRVIREDGTEWPSSSLPAQVTLRTGEPVIGVTMGVERPNGMVWLSVNSQPMRTADGDVDGVIVTFSDITDQRMAQAALRSSEARVDEAAEALIWQSFHDPLTHLPNRTLLLDRVTTALERARLSGSKTALLVLDLDRFKNVNETMGHDVGDRLLVEVAERLQRTVRAGDTVARLGGDEFVVLVESLSNRDEATQLADRIRAAVAQPIALPKGPVTITTSVGIAFDVDHRATSMLRDADTALYKAKDHGRDRWDVFDESLRAATVRRVAAEQLIRQALDDDGLRVHYQPIVDLVTGQVVSAEALLRIEGPHGDLLPPSSFISIAEETGLIVPVGAGVLDEACAQLARWRVELGSRAPATVSVNLAARQLASGTFPEVVERTLERHGLDAGSLTLELTESTLIEAGRHALEAVGGLHELGVQLAIDDFGTGYSSLSYLQRFPVDIVKVDRSFVDGLGTPSNDTEIVRAVLALGQSLGLTTVAEGVETAPQLAALQRLGCDRAQGFLFGRPVAASQLTDTVDRIGHLTALG